MTELILLIIKYNQVEVNHRNLKFHLHLEFLSVFKIGKKFLKSTNDLTKDTHYNHI